LVVQGDLLLDLLADEALLRLVLDDFELELFDLLVLQLDRLAKLLDFALQGANTYELVRGLEYLQVRFLVLEGNVCFQVLYFLS